MTRWWWVRHGPTHQKAFTGWRDVPADLSDTDQIARLEAHLPRNAVVISSDLIRAVETASAIQGPRERLPHSPNLREFNFGVWDGLKFDEVAARDPELSRAFWEKPGDLAAPDGESWNDVAARVQRQVDDLTSRYTGHDIIAVAHIGVILTQVQAAGKMDPYKALSFSIDNLSVTQTSFDGSNWSLGPINHIP